MFENNTIRRDKTRHVPNCSPFRDLSRNQGYRAAALHRLTRDEEPSRAGIFRRDLCTRNPSLQSIKPNFLNLFIKKFTRDRVVPTIPARVSWLISGTTLSGASSLP